MDQEYIISRGWIVIASDYRKEYRHGAYNFSQDGFQLVMQVHDDKVVIVKEIIEDQLLDEESVLFRQVLFDGILTENKQLDMIMSLLDYTF